MGLFDFFKKGDEKPANPQATPKNNVVKPAAPSQPSVAQPQAAQPAQPAAPQKEYYTVKSGDSLSKIAKQLYGDANAWHKIHQANTDQIKDPNLIHPGQKIVIPR
ncbi:LysM peptidoglycan-binding domain-containing protein [Adhaeribacter aquaticus]|uniref:LysM peptidoglycan-binding domain-containing protein n=1 Tax=Adhaeribacter aquaticus TaxID=299567 RepID=UPI00041C048D|nr:LysM peptidoglycan-binding domain-containing protein [Adhaeribacter aquaticus]